MSVYHRYLDALPDPVVEREMVRAILFMLGITNDDTPGACRCPNRGRDCILDPDSNSTHFPACSRGHQLPSCVTESEEQAPTPGPGSKTKAKSKPSMSTVNTVLLLLAVALVMFIVIVLVLMISKKGKSKSGSSTQSGQRPVRRKSNTSQETESKYHPLEPYKLRT